MPLTKLIFNVFNADGCRGSSRSSRSTFRFLRVFYVFRYAIFSIFFGFRSEGKVALDLTGSGFPNTHWHDRMDDLQNWMCLPGPARPSCTCLSGLALSKNCLRSWLLSSWVRRGCWIAPRYVKPRESEMFSEIKSWELATGKPRRGLRTLMVTAHSHTSHPPSLPALLFHDSML